MDNKLKSEITTFLLDRGADLIGFAATETWAKEGMVPERYRPDALWPHVNSVIVIGCQMPLPIVETTPSVQHRDLYNTCNRMLDDLAFHLSRWLNRHGHASIPLSRDGYANIQTLIRKPGAAFSHVFAAQYAGLGYIGINNTILTKKFGPRVRFVSVFTEAKIPPDPMLREGLCIRCGACADLCPVGALKISKKALREDVIITAQYNRRSCTEWARLLTQRGCYPCGICIKVCPVGEDRGLYERDQTARHYRREIDTSVTNSPDPFYRSWNHIRNHGSLFFNEDITSDDTLRSIIEKIKNNMDGREQ